MKKINQTLQGLTNNTDFQNRYEGLKKEVFQNKDVQDFIHQYEQDITEQMIERSLGKLYEYITQSKQCQQCTSLDQCNNMMKGFHPQLIMQGNSIDLQYDRCPRKVVYDERRKHERLIQSIYVPQDILNASFEQFDFDKGRIKASKLADAFVENFRQGNKQKGIYFHGKFGVGKSYLLGAIANGLAKKEVSSMIVYVPEFIREMKSAIGEQTLNEKLDVIKKVPVLMLDDLGAETMSSWVRDEIFGTILQFRMLENLPTFFTSNFNFTELEHHLTYSQRGEEEKIKAARIMERIKYLADPVLIDGPNRREN